MAQSAPVSPELLTIQISSQVSQIMRTFWNLTYSAYETHDTLFLSRGVGASRTLHPRLVAIDHRDSVGDFWARLDQTEEEKRQEQATWEGEV
jgi:hypothetical protein